MARIARIKGALTVLDATGKIVEINQMFDNANNGNEIAKLTITIAHGLVEYQIPFGPIPQTVAFYLNASAPINVKYNANTNTAHQITGPVIEFSKITALYVTPDPVLDITLDVILVGP